MVGTAVHAAVAPALAVVLTPQTVHAVLAQGVCIKGFLLCRGQGGVESLDGFATAVGFGAALGAQGTHAVDAFGGGECLYVLVVQARGAFAGLQLTITVGYRHPEDDPYYESE